MIEVRNKRVLVVGLGRSGRAVALCLQKRGAKVTVTDQRPPWAFRKEIPALMAHKIGLELGRHEPTLFLSSDLIVLSPGVPWNLPAVEAARQKGVAVLPEVEVAGWYLQGRLIGITGSNGKTTTTTLLGRMLEASGFPTFVAGNIGNPLVELVSQDSADSLIVAELSSFQLEPIREFHPQVAVLLNLTPNHLDRHASFEDYVQAKAQIFRNQTAEDYAILNADDPEVMKLAPFIAARQIRFSRRQDLPEGVFLAKNQIIYRVSKLEKVLFEEREVRLRGEFNLDNVLAATAAACVLGADFDAIRQAVKEFQGVEHRLEFVREIRGVDFFNDSKATSVDATAKALSAFERGVHLILGGKGKGAPYTPLRALLEGRVREIQLIGADAGRIAKDLRGSVELVRAGDLKTALWNAAAQAVPGDTVLLAPACASFDQFKDFEHRGQTFKQLVAELANEVESQGFLRYQRQEMDEPAKASAPVSEDKEPSTSDAVETKENGVSPLSAKVAADMSAAEAKVECGPVATEPGTRIEFAEPVANSPQEGAGDAAVFEPEPTSGSSGAQEVEEQETGAEQPERLLVYEVEAEEFRPESANQDAPFEEASIELTSDETHPLESVEDDPFPFEVRPAKEASGPVKSSVSGQSRLPGL